MTEKIDYTREPGGRFHPDRSVPCCRAEAMVGDHAPDCWTRDPHKLPWYPGLGTVLADAWSWRKLGWRHYVHRRCEARTPILGSFNGRCELEEHTTWVDHALERGMYTPRWTTRWTG